MTSIEVNEQAIGADQETGSGIWEKREHAQKYRKMRQKFYIFGKRFELLNSHITL